MIIFFTKNETNRKKIANKDRNLSIQVVKLWLQFFQ
jgi:hypothetical protein